MEVKHIANTAPPTSHRDTLSDSEVVDAFERRAAAAADQRAAIAANQRIANRRSAGGAVEFGGGGFRFRILGQSLGPAVYGFSIDDSENLRLRILRGEQIENPNCMIGFLVSSFALAGDAVETVNTKTRSVQKHS